VVARELTWKRERNPDIWVGREPTGAVLATIIRDDFMGELPYTWSLHGAARSAAHHRGGAVWGSDSALDAALATAGRAVWLAMGPEAG